MVSFLQNLQKRMQAADMTIIQLVVDFKYQRDVEEISLATCTISSPPNSRIAATATKTCDVRDSRNVICSCKAGFMNGNVSNAPAISRKLTSIEITNRSTPRKKSPARLHPRTHKLAMIAVIVNA